MTDYIKPLLINNKAMFLAYDHGFEHGPKDLSGKSIDPNYILDLAIQGQFTAIILQKGIAEKYYFNTKYAKNIPLIIKINGKTNINTQSEPYSPINCSVRYAKKLGAQAVGYTIYLGSEHENRMLEEFGVIQEEAHRLKMAAIAWLYPRGKSIIKDNDSELIKYAARLGLELGADLIKIKYPDSDDALKDIIKLAGKTKVVLSGGEKDEQSEFLSKVQKVIINNFSGIAVGRNIWQRENALEIAEQLRKIIWG